jgi:hypothetical protein
MPQLELNSMVFLMNAMQFRILPLYHNFNHGTLLLRYPLLSNIRGESADQDCDTLVAKLEAAIRKTRTLIESQITQSDRILMSDRNLDRSSNGNAEIDQNEMKGIWTELRKNTTKYRKEATIAKPRHYSENKRIWKYPQTWEIISYLLQSSDNEDIINGLYIMEYMLKTSKNENSDDSRFVIENAKERYASQLLKLIYPSPQIRIPQDSFRLLKTMIEENVLSKYSLDALRIAMEKINNDNEYQDYIQIYVWYFDNAPSNILKDLCDFMYSLTSQEDKLGKRAGDLYNYFIKKI